MSEVASAGPAAGVRRCPFHRLAVLPVLLLALAAAACGRGEPVAAGGPWQVLALTCEGAVVHVGAGCRDVVRELGRVPLGSSKSWTGPEVPALEMRFGGSISWRVELSRPSHFSYVPLGVDHPRCRGRYRVAVTSLDGAAEPVELERRPVGAVGRFAPGTVEVDLSELSGPLKLTLEVVTDGPACAARARWGHPRVIGRGGPAVTASEAPPPPPPPQSLPPSLPRRDPPPNLIVIGLDTFRADRLGPRSGGRPSLTPALDRLAGEADVWARAYSPLNNTNPSFASLFTGLYAKNHGIYDLSTPLAPEHVTLAEVLSEAGYDTLAALGASHLRPKTSGLGQGFDAVRAPRRWAAAETVVAQAMEWIDGRGARPFFAWLHLFDAHTPTLPPRPYAEGMAPAALSGPAPVPAWRAFRRPGRREFSEARLAGHPDLYDGEVAYLDRQLDLLFTWLDSRGLLDTTVVAVVGDHGESLGEHGILHRHDGLYDVSVHVPLLVRWPSGRGEPRPSRRFDGLVQTIDLFPTLLAGLGLPVPEGLDARDLYRLGDAGRPVVFFEHANRMGAGLRTARHKYLEVAAAGSPLRPQLFDLAADPGETVDLAGRGLPEEERLAAALAAWRGLRRGTAGTVGTPAPAQLSTEDLEQLRALGYL